MFEDSESDSDSDEEKAPERRVVDTEAPLPDEGVRPAKKMKTETTRPQPVRRPAPPVHRPAPALLSKLKESYQAARPPPVQHQALDSADADYPSHWTSAKIAEAQYARESGEPAYHRPSLHGKSIVVSVGPSSLPKTVRTTLGKIPNKDSHLR